MASQTPISQSQILVSKPRFQTPGPQPSSSFTIPNFHSNFLPKLNSVNFYAASKLPKMPIKAVVGAAKTAENPRKRYPGEAKGFVEEMRFVAMKLHTREQAKEGEKEVKAPEERSVTKWEPTVDGYLRFLVDSKLLYDTLEEIVEKAPFPLYAEFRNTGLERSEKLAKDLKWFKEQGYAIPEPSSPGVTYAQFLEELSEKDPQAFLCHFYNIYFAHTAGGRMIGRKVQTLACKVLINKIYKLRKCAKIILAKDLEWFKEQGYAILKGVYYLKEFSEKDPRAFLCHFYNIFIYFAHTASGRMIGRKVAEKILNNKELEFYKWDADLSQLLQSVREKLNKVAESWTREEKNHCLEETEKSFKYSGDTLRLILS